MDDPPVCASMACGAIARLDLEGVVIKDANQVDAHAGFMRYLLTRLRISCRGALSICDVAMHMHYTYFYTIRSIIHADYREPQEHEVLQ